MVNMPPHRVLILFSNLNVVAWTRLDLSCHIEAPSMKCFESQTMNLNRMLKNGSTYGWLRLGLGNLGSSFSAHMRFKLDLQANYLRYVLKHSSKLALRLSLQRPLSLLRVLRTTLRQAATPSATYVLMVRALSSMICRAGASLPESR